MSSSDLNSWRITAIILLIISTIVFMVGKIKWLIFDPIFEICIFYIPTILAISIYFFKARKTVNH